MGKSSKFYDHVYVESSLTCNYCGTVLGGWDEDDVCERANEEDWTVTKSGKVKCVGCRKNKSKIKIINPKKK